MRALITQREAVDAHGEWVDILEARYVTYFAEMGITVRPVPNNMPNLERLLDDEKFDGLILTGGGDVPEEFFDYPHKSRTQYHRDKTEKRLVDFCLREKKPILGICRGMQYLNGLWGGRVSVLDNLKVERPIGNDHPVDVDGELWLVNQYHNDGIYARNLAEGLKPLAMDWENQVVEAFTAEKEQVLAVQWHPERPFSTEEARRKTAELIRTFFKLGENIE